MIEVLKQRFNARFSAIQRQLFVDIYHGKEQETPIHEGANLTIKNAQDWEEGEYRCIAEGEGFP